MTSVFRGIVFNFYLAICGRMYIPKPAAATYVPGHLMSLHVALTFLQRGSVLDSEETRLSLLLPPTHLQPKQTFEIAPVSRRWQKS